MKQTEKLAVLRQPPPAISSWRPWLLGASLVLLVAVVYWPTLGNGFIWDDDFYVENNATLKSSSGLHDIWFKLGAVPQYYPLVHSTFWVEYHLWGLDPRGYHAVNVLLHAVSAVLVWRLLLRLGVPGAWLAGAIFAVHPVEVESVAWVTERKNVLSCVLALGSLLAYLRFSPPELPRSVAAETPKSGHRVGYYALAFALYVAALLAKTVTASVPAVLLVIYWWKRGRLRWRDVLPLVPFFAVGLALARVTVWIEKHIVGAQGEEWDLSGLERLLIAGRAAWFYAGKLVWPSPLIFFYPRWTIDTHVWWQYLFPLAVLVLLVGLWLARNRIGRGPLAAALVFGGVLTPALGFFDVFPFRYSFVADHFQYHASIALIALAAAALVLAAARVGKQRWSASLAAAAVLLPLGILARQQTRVYAGLQSVWEHTVALNPSCWAAYNNLGSCLLRQRKYDESINCLREAIRLLPQDAMSRNNLACVLLKLERFDEAAAELADALPCKTDDLERARTHAYLGAVLMARKRFDEAMENLNRAIALYPDLPVAYEYRGRLRATQGDASSGLSDVERALKLEPGNVEVMELHAALLASAGKYEPALVELNALRETMPDNRELQIQIAAVYLASKQGPKAVAMYDHVLRTDVNNAAAYRGRADAYLSLGKQAAAIADYKTALQVEPNHSDALNNLAWVLATSPDGKLRDGKRAVELGKAACKATGYKRAEILSTLAAAYAEAGDFEAAIAWSKKALKIGGQQLQERLTQQLESFQSQKPWRETLSPADEPDLKEAAGPTKASVDANDQGSRARHGADKP